jgi:hypothetical protein
MIDALAKGDEVVTAGGMLGKVSKLGDNYLGIEIANGVEIQIQRAPWCRFCPRARSSKDKTNNANRAGAIMNRYPVWKYAIILIALVVGAVVHPAQSSLVKPLRCRFRQQGVVKVDLHHPGPVEDALKAGRYCR